jgi:two-component system, LytTR family, response regulator
MRVLVIDDESNARESLVNLIQKYAQEYEIVGEAHNAEDAYHKIVSLNPDVLLLDIEMPNGSGFDLLKRFPDPEFKVIFVTGFDQYALNSIKFNALDYILKPVNIEELIQALAKAKASIQLLEDNKALRNLLEVQKSPNSLNNKIVLKTTNHTNYVEVGTILYCESKSQFTKVMLQDGKSYIVSNNIGEYEDMLVEYQFMRVHTSFVVYRKAVSAMVKNGTNFDLLLHNGEKIPISRRRKAEVSDWLED